MQLYFASSWTAGFDHPYALLLFWFFVVVGFGVWLVGLFFKKVSTFNTFNVWQLNFNYYPAGIQGQGKEVLETNVVPVGEASLAQIYNNSLVARAYWKIRLLSKTETRQQISS